MTVLDLTFNNQTGDKTQTAGFYLKILKKAIQILKMEPHGQAPGFLCYGQALQGLAVGRNPAPENPIHPRASPWFSGARIKVGIGLSLNLVGEPLIRSLNAEHRNQNQVTDVLAFGLGKKPVGAIMELGDIFICLPYAKKQARAAGVSPEQKLVLLTIHGFLHLLGHDHEKSKKEAEEMFNLQEKILNSCAL